MMSELEDLMGDLDDVLSNLEQNKPSKPASKPSKPTPVEKPTPQKPREAREPRSQKPKEDEIRAAIENSPLVQQIIQERVQEQIQTLLTKPIDDGLVAAINELINRKQEKSVDQFLEYSQFWSWIKNKVKATHGTDESLAAHYGAFNRAMDDGMAQEFEPALLKEMGYTGKTKTDRKVPQEWFTLFSMYLKETFGQQPKLTQNAEYYIELFDLFKQALLQEDMAGDKQRSK